MKKSEGLFFELLLLCCGARSSLKQHYTDKEWIDTFNIAEKQTLTGVLLSALEELPKEQLPPQELLLQWIGMAQIQEANSLKLAEAGKIVIAYFREKGSACQILKGSSVARYYPKPMWRTSGDIDVWVDGGRKKIYDFARNCDKDGKLYGVNYHHIHFHLLEDVHIELHIWPSFLSSPLRNHLFHKFCKLHKPSYKSDMPSLAFDRVYILLHCYRHICGHGVGFRQIMDYYYVLKQGFTEKERQESVMWINKLGMRRFAQGIMWLFQQYFGLERQFLLLPPNKEEGRFILNEIMQTGNMGNSDTRSWGSLQSPLSRFFYNLRRDIFLVRHYPHEALWQPFFSIWLYAWRWSKGLLGSEDND